MRVCVVVGAIGLLGCGLGGSSARERYEDCMIAFAEHQDMKTLVVVDRSYPREHCREAANYYPTTDERLEAAKAYWASMDKAREERHDAAFAAAAFLTPKGATNDSHIITHDARECNALPSLPRC